ncbi:MAG: carboxypeptidase regulatory-like domain-containing protein [Gemmatimonadota bacterium]
MKTLTRFSCLILILTAALQCDSESRNPLESPETLMATIHGVVTHGGSPIGGTEVSLTGPHIRRTTNSGPDGGFTFADLPPGIYTLTVVLSGLACESMTAEMEAGETVAVSIACVEQFGAIAGTVTADGSAIEGATVRLSRVGVELTRTTGADGAFAFDSVLAGLIFALTVNTPEADCGGRNVVVRADQTSTADIVCKRVGALRVNVTQSDVPDLQWVFVLHVTGPVTTTRNGVLGTLVPFMFNDLPPGAYAVAAGVASEGLYCQSAVATVQVARGTTVDIHCTFRQTGTPSIRGQVTINGAGRGLVPVELREPSRTSLLGLTTTVSFDENGSGGSGNYQFRDLAPGDYAVIARMPAGAPCDAIQKETTVREGRETILNFACASRTTGSIAGFVDSENLPDVHLAGRSVTVTGPVDRVTTTGPWNGVYAFDDLPPGDYVVTSWCGESASVNVQAGQTAPATMLCF